MNLLILLSVWLGASVIAALVHRCVNKRNAEPIHGAKDSD